VTILEYCKWFIVKDLYQKMKNIPKIAKKLVAKRGGFAYFPP
jgi:phage pi2 protein 07